MENGILTQHYTPVQVSKYPSQAKLNSWINPVDCGAPLFPPNSTNTTVSGATVGAMATFQCEEGLIPSGPTTSTCTDTETGGQWLPTLLTHSVLFLLQQVRRLASFKFLDFPL